MKPLNCRGQALIEFVIILPISIFIIFAGIDIGKIIFMQNSLEDRMDEVIISYRAGKNIEEISKNLKFETDHISLNISDDQEYPEFELIKETTILTPGLNLILGNPFKIKTTRVIYNG